jgi:hypothetical protein
MAASHEVLFDSDRVRCAADMYWPDDMAETCRVW